MASFGKAYQPLSIMFNSILIFQCMVEGGYAVIFSMEYQDWACYLPDFVDIAEYVALYTQTFDIDNGINYRCES